MARLRLRPLGAVGASARARALALALVLSLLCAGVAPSARAQQCIPGWAPRCGAPLHIPGSSSADARRGRVLLQAEPPKAEAEAPRPSRASAPEVDTDAPQAAAQAPAAGAPAADTPGAPAAAAPAAAAAPSPNGVAPAQRKDLAQAQAANTVTAMLRMNAETKEPATGIEFAPTLTPPGIENELTLLGTGLREKKVAFFTAKVYAVGFYLDVRGMKKLWKGKSGADIAGAQDFVPSLVDAPADKALVLTLARTLSAQQLKDGLKESLTPRLQARGGDPGLIDQLAALFGDKDLQEGTSIVLGWAQPDTLVVDMGLAAQGNGNTIVSESLVEALFDVYLGKDSVAPDLPKRITDTVSAAN